MKKILTSILLTLSATTFAQIPSYVPSNGLVGWWPFNGNANDASGNGNNGTVNGATLTTDRNNLSNAAYSFASNNIMIPLNQTIVNMPARTISLWFNSSASQSGGRLFETTSYSWGIGCYNSTQFDCWYQKSNKAYNAINLNFGSNNSWHNLVYTCDSVAGNVKVYLNGVNIHSSNAVSNPGNPIAWLNHFIKVGQGNANESFIGKIDDIGIWNRALTQTEITNLYNSINTPAPTVSVSPASTTICPGSSATLTATTSGSTACSSSGLPTSLQTGLVGYWPFCGNANDASGNGNNGAVNGATLTTDRFGNTSSAYNFNGSSNYIDVGNNNSLNSNIVTISAWYNAVDYGSSAQGFQGNLVSKREQSGWGGAYQLALMSNPSNLVYAPYTISGQNGNVYSTLQPLGQWIHVVYVHDLNSARIYINGVLSGTTIVSGGLTSNNLPVWFGARPNAGGLSHFFNGKLDDIAIWNRALTVSEIQQLYTSSNATYSWSPSGATTQSITVSPTTTTTYTVTATANGQSSTSTAVVTVTTPPTITASSSSICAGQSATLTAAATGVTPISPCSPLTGSLSTGIVGYWPFCGNANDVSGNGNNGIVNGATLTSDRYGSANSAYQFNGINQFINLGALSSLGSNPPIVSYSFWMNITDYPSSTIAYPIFSRRHQDLLGHDWCSARVEPDGKIKFFKDDDFYVGTPAQTDTLAFNVWSHFVMIKNGDLLQLYKDGQLISTITDSHVLAGSPGSFYIARQGAWNFYFKGKLDDFGIWNRALTVSEIQQLYTQGPITYSWSPGGETTPSITVSPTSTTTYTCTVTANGTACSSSQTITVNALPVASITPAGPVNLCQGQSVTLCAPNTPGLTYLWCNASTTSCITTNSAGNYCLVITDANGCTSNSVSTIVNVAPLPTVNAGVDFTKTCVSNASGSVIGMSPVSGVTYAWIPSTGISNPVLANPTANPTATTTYTLTATNTASGCTATDQVLVTVNTSLPTVNAGLDQTLCQGVSTVLNASSNGSTLNWNNGVQNNVSFVPSTVGTTTYTATATGSNGCTNSDNVLVTVNPLPSAVVTSNGAASFCPGSSVQLCAPSGTGNSYLWSGNLGSTQCITVSSSMTTSVTVTNSFNCSATSTPQQVTVFNNPVASAGLDATVTCAQNASGAQIGDVPNPTYTYSWTPSSGLSSATIGDPIANPIATTTYTLTVVNADGCMGSDQVTVTVNNTPPIVYAGNDANVCNGDSLYLFANTTIGSTVVWNGTIQNGSNVLPVQSGYQVATATATNGCTSQDSLLVNILQPTTSTLNEVACNEFYLNGSVYLQSGSYTQQLTNVVGCDSTITLNLTINPSPNQPVVYVQNEVNLSTDVVPGLTYQWINCTDLTDVLGATNPDFNPTVNALYAVVVSNNCGSDTSVCAEVSTIGLVDNQQPEIKIYPNPNNGHLSILLPACDASAKLEVLDLNGRIVYKTQLHTISNEIHIEYLATGTYLLKVEGYDPLPIIKN
jgi:hypothetical protein